MAKLPAEYEDYLRTMSKSGRLGIDNTREKRLTPIYERTGLRSPALTRESNKMEENLLTKLSETRAGFGLESLKRTESKEDAATQREFQKFLQGQQLGFGRQQLASQEKESKLNREATVARDEAQREWEKKLMEEEFTRQKNLGISSFLTNLITGGVMGMFDPSLFGIEGKTDASGEKQGPSFMQRIAGGGMGSMFGGETAGGMFAMQRYLDYVEKGK